MIINACGSEGVKPLSNNTLCGYEGVNPLSHSYCTTLLSLHMMSLGIMAPTLTSSTKLHDTPSQKRKHIIAVVKTEEHLKYDLSKKRKKPPSPLSSTTITKKQQQNNKKQKKSTTTTTTTLNMSNLTNVAVTIPHSSRTIDTKNQALIASYLVPTNATNDHDSTITNLPTE